MELDGDETVELDVDYSEDFASQSRELLHIRADRSPIPKSWRDERESLFDSRDQDVSDR